MFNVDFLYKNLSYHFRYYFEKKVICFKEYEKLYGCPRLIDRHMSEIVLSILTAAEDYRKANDENASKFAQLLLNSLFYASEKKIKHIFGKDYVP